MNGNAILFSERYGNAQSCIMGFFGRRDDCFVNREAFDKYKMSKEEFELLPMQKKRPKSRRRQNKDKEKVDEKPQDIVMEFENMDQRIVRLTPNLFPV